MNLLTFSSSPAKGTPMGVSVKTPLIGDYVVGWNSAYRPSVTNEWGVLVFSDLEVPAMPAELRDEIMAARRHAGWCAPKALAITEEDCEAAVRLLTRILLKGAPRPTYVSPSPKGNVALEWRHGSNLIHVEVTARRPGEVYYQWAGPTSGQKNGFAAESGFVDRLVEHLTRDQ